MFTHRRVVDGRVEAGKTEHDDVRDRPRRRVPREVGRGDGERVLPRRAGVEQAAARDRRRRRPTARCSSAPRPASEQPKVARTCWLSVNVRSEAAGERGSTGRPCRSIDWKLTALLKLKPTLPALSCASRVEQDRRAAELTMCAVQRSPPPCVSSLDLPGRARRRSRSRRRWCSEPESSVTRTKALKPSARS